MLDWAHLQVQWMSFFSGGFDSSSATIPREAWRTKQAQKDGLGRKKWALAAHRTSKPLPILMGCLSWITVTPHVSMAAIGQPRTQPIIRSEKLKNRDQRQCSMQQRSRHARQKRRLIDTRSLEQASGCREIFVAASLLFCCPKEEQNGNCGRSKRGKRTGEGIGDLIRPAGAAPLLGTTGPAWLSRLGALCLSLCHCSVVSASHSPDEPSSGPLPGRPIPSHPLTLLTLPYTPPQWNKTRHCPVPPPFSLYGARHLIPILSPSQLAAVPTPQPSNFTQPFPVHQLTTTPRTPGSLVRCPNFIF